MARTIREELNLTDLPIFMLTVVRSVREVPYRFAPDEDCLAVDVFTDKPIEPKTLIDTIKEMLRERREELECSL